MENKKASIQFLKFLVRESHISFNEIGEYKIALDFNAHAVVEQSVTKYHLFIQTKVKEDDDKFNIDVVAEAIFDYDGEIAIDDLKNGLFTKNAPAIVFPYIRAYIASLTALSGVPTLSLPTLNLTKLGEDLMNNIEVRE